MNERVTVMHIENFTKLLFQVVDSDIFISLTVWENYLFALLIHSKFLGDKPSKSDYRIQEYDDYQTERRIAAEIMQTVNRLALPFKLDRLTEGLGKQFPNPSVNWSSLNGNANLFTVCVISAAILLSVW